MPVVLYTEDYGLGDGDPVVALSGTKTSVPRGIEAVFTYNGLTMNDTSNVDKYRIMQIDGLDDPDIRDSREDNPGTHGETIYDAFYGGRTLAINGRIESYNIYKLRDMQQALRTAFIDISQEMPLYFLTGDPKTDHYINCKKLSKLQWADEQKDQFFFRDFLITLRASNPRFFSNLQSTTEINYGAGDRVANIINVGNFQAQPTLFIYGPITEPKIRNTTTGETLAFQASTTIADGDFYKITFNNDIITVSDSNGVNKFSKLAYTSDAININPRTINNLTTAPGTVGGNTGTGGNTKFIINFHHSWI